MIKLEPFTSADFDQLIGWIDNDELMTKWSGALFSFPLTPKSLEWYIADTNEPGVSDAFVYKAVDDETGETVGHISIGGISWKNRSARISRVFISNESRGRGYCRQMIYETLKIAFDELKLHRVGLGAYNDNAAALHCYEQNGFKTEGTSRDILNYNGQWWSMIEMSILEEEWQEGKLKMKN